MNFSLMSFCQSLRQASPAVLTTKRLLRSSSFAFLDLAKKTFQRTFYVRPFGPGRKKARSISNGTAKVESFFKLTKYFYKIFQNLFFEI